MPVNEILHLIFGCVSLRAENGFVERFINTCTAEEIPLWDMRKVGDRLTAKTSVAGYKKIRSPARKSGMRVRMTAKRGLPFWLNRHLKRPGLIIGFTVLFVALLILSGHVWLIEVDGNTVTETAQILEAYEKAGLRVGSRKSKLNAKQVETEALLNVPTLSWTKVNINGSRAVIKVRELSESPEIEQSGTTANVIAAKDGQVQILEPYRGTNAVKPGATVKKGDLLISGVTKSRTETYLFSYARGYAVATTRIRVSLNQPTSRAELAPASTKLYSVFVLGRELPMKPKREAEMCYAHRSWMMINGKRMPFGVFYRLYTDFQPTEKKMSPAEVRLTAVNNYHLKAYAETLHAQIIDGAVKLTENENGISISGEYSCYENIGVQSEFSVEEAEEIKPD